MAGHLLLATDAGVFAERIEACFLRHGWQVTVVSDADRFVSVINSNCPDAVVLDFDVRWVGAMSVLASINRHDRGDASPVMVFVSRFAENPTPQTTAARRFSAAGDVSAIYSAVARLTS